MQQQSKLSRVKIVIFLRAGGPQKQFLFRICIRFYAFFHAQYSDISL
jgi:hypothetical protein